MEAFRFLNMFGEHLDLSKFGFFYVWNFLFCKTAVMHWGNLSDHSGHKLLFYKIKLINWYVKQWLYKNSDSLLQWKILKY